MLELDLLHRRKRRHHKRRRHGGSGLRKARCVRNCRAGKGRFKRGKHTLGRCRRACHVKKK